MTGKKDMSSGKKGSRADRKKRECRKRDSLFMNHDELPLSFSHLYGHLRYC